MHRLIVASLVLCVAVACSPDAPPPPSQQEAAVEADEDLLARPCKRFPERCQPPAPGTTTVTLAWDYGATARFQIYETVTGTYGTVPAAETSDRSIVLTRAIDGLNHCYVVTATVNGVQSGPSNEGCKQL